MQIQSAKIWLWKPFWPRIFRERIFPLASGTCITWERWFLMVFQLHSISTSMLLSPIPLTEFFPNALMLHSFLVVFSVRREIFLIGADMYCCSWISKPGIGTIWGSICPHDQCVCNGVDCVRDLSIILPGELSLLTSSFGPTLCLDVAQLVAVFTFQLGTSLEHYIGILASRIESLSPTPFSVETWNDYFRIQNSPQSAYYWIPWRWQHG